MELEKLVHNMMRAWNIREQMLFWEHWATPKNLVHYNNNFFLEGEWTQEEFDDRVFFLSEIEEHCTPGVIDYWFIEYLYEWTWTFWLRDHESFVYDAESGVTVISCLVPLSELFVASGMCESLSEFRRKIKQNGIRINDTVVTDPKYMVTPGDFRCDASFIISVGKVIKSSYYIIAFEDPRPRCHEVELAEEEYPIPSIGKGISGYLQKTVQKLRNTFTTSTGSNTLLLDIVVAKESSSQNSDEVKPPTIKPSANVLPSK